MLKLEPNQNTILPDRGTPVHAARGGGLGGSAVNGVRGDATPRVNSQFRCSVLPVVVPCCSSLFGARNSLFRFPCYSLFRASLLGAESTAGQGFAYLPRRRGFFFCGAGSGKRQLSRRRRREPRKTRKTRKGAAIFPRPGPAGPRRARGASDGEQPSCPSVLSVSSVVQKA